MKTKCRKLTREEAEAESAVALAAHDELYAKWQKMNDKQRGAAIRNAVRMAI